MTALISHHIKPQQANNGMCEMQVIYPLSVKEAAAMEEGSTPDQRWAALDRRLDGLMAAVRLAYLVKREGGWSATASWGDTLSLGEHSACCGRWAWLK